jgi:hypothetical protein
VLRLPKWGGKEEVPFISIADDYGDIVHGVFLDPQKWNGKLVQGTSDIRDFDSLVKAFEKGRCSFQASFGRETDHAK